MAKKNITAITPPRYELADVSALKHLAAGTADQHQQQRALKWIIDLACQTYQPSYRNGLDGDRETAFAEGRRFVGLMIVEKLKLDLNDLRRVDEYREAQAVQRGRKR